MTEQQTPVMEQAAGTAPAKSTPPPAPKKKKKKKKAVKTIITIVVVLAVLAAIGFALWYFVFREVPEDMGEIMTAPVMRSSIQSTVEGSGQTKAKNSAAITPTAGGTILELYVKEGDQVQEGDPLYRMDDTDALQGVTDAQKTVDNCQKELQAIYDKALDLTINAPHAGKLMDIATIKPGDDVSEGTKIATLVNDTKLRLHLYYNYVYEGQITVGQSAQISIPAVMDTFSGKVEAINMVSRIVPEGGKCFEVVFVMDNPDTLTEGMDASAILTAPDGSSIYPYENTKLEYYETTEIKAKATGPVEAANLLNYKAVQAGQLLVQLGAKNNDEEIATKENALNSALDKLEEAQQTLGNFNAVAPITGTVLSCGLVEGQKVEANQGISIADTTEMTVEIQVDERNVRYVEAGMMVNIEQYGAMYMGIVESVSQNATAQNGVATFPAVVKVDNSDGLLMSNMYVQYSFVASESDNCLVVPVQAVKYVSLNSGGLNVNTEPGMEGGDDLLPAEDGDPLPAEDGDLLPAEDGDLLPAEDGASDVVIMPNIEGGDAAAASGMQYTEGGYSLKPLMSVAMGRPMGGGGGGSTATDANTGEATIVFVKAAEKPANAIEADPAWECPEGFYPVIVEVGLADNTNVEIKSGLNEGDEVFIGHMKQSADSWG